MTTGAAKRPTFLQELMDRAAALSPAQYRAPDRNRGPDETAVGEAHDYHKRLYTLAADLTETMKPLRAEYEACVGEMRSLATSNMFWKLIDMLLYDVETARTKANRVKELEVLLSDYSREQDIIMSIFWHEVYRDFPALTDGMYAWVNCDWQITWTKTSPVPDLARIAQGSGMIEIRVG